MFSHDGGDVKPCIVQPTLLPLNSPKFIPTFDCQDLFEKNFDLFLRGQPRVIASGELRSG
jgi:hypothetical protein